LLSLATIKFLDADNGGDTVNDISGFSQFAAAQANGQRTTEIGRVLEILGSSSVVAFDAMLLQGFQNDSDLTLATAGNIGSHVKIRVGRCWLVGVVRSLKLVNADGDLVMATIDYLGEGLALEDSERFKGFRRGATRYPLPGARVHACDGHDMQTMFGGQTRPHIEVGRVHPTTDVRATILIDALLGKHFALIGSTGTGKSTATALVLHRICAMAPNGHIVMVDPHGEYGAAFSDTGHVFNVQNLAMPYWLMNFREHCEMFLTGHGDERQQDADILARCLLQARAKNRAAEGISRLSVDSPVPYSLNDLILILNTEMGKLEKSGGTAPYTRIKTKIEEMRSDLRYAFMFSGVLTGDSMNEFLSRVFRLPGDGKPISIIDVSSVPSEITSTVVAVLARMVFDYAIWSRGETQRPILLVCEEAHRYIPNDRTQTSYGQSVRLILERIAKEGRKYGVSLGLVTQRPSDLAEGVLSQLGTIITMRLNNERDQAFVRSAMPEGAKAFLDSIPSLRNRECIISGEGVTIPVRVSLDDLAQPLRPASHDPLFSDLWRDPLDDITALDRTIRRWRSQGK
jgi:uncharacterized protein